MRAAATGFVIAHLTSPASASPLVAGSRPCRNRRPFRICTICSAMPPTSAAMTRRRRVDASATTRGNDSDRLGTTTASAALNRSARVSRESSGPPKYRRSATPKDLQLRRLPTLMIGRVVRCAGVMRYHFPMAASAVGYPYRDLQIPRPSCAPTGSRVRVLRRGPGRSVSAHSGGRGYGLGVLLR